MVCEESYKGLAFSVLPTLETQLQVTSCKRLVHAVQDLGGRYHWEWLEKRVCHPYSNYQKTLPI